MDQHGTQHKAPADGFSNMGWPEHSRKAPHAIRQASHTSKPIFYRFQKPVDHHYPAMIELFARAPDGLLPVEGSQLTPIPLDEAVSSLSAILLNDAYYALIIEGRREVAGLPCVGEDRLIPLKAVAWLELSERKEQSAKVDAKDVCKHLDDILRLSQLLAPTTRISLGKKIAADISKFLTALASDTSIDPKVLQLGNVSVADVITRIAQAYELDLLSK